MPPTLNVEYENGSVDDNSYITDRPPDEFGLTKAILTEGSLPAERTKDSARVGFLDSDRWSRIYCRGGYCRCSVT
jgi:hypothetical protein